VPDGTGVTYRQLARKLRAMGCELKRHSKGSHEIWTNPRTNSTAVVPNHPGEVPAGTLNAVLRELGIGRDEFNAS